MLKIQLIISLLFVTIAVLAQSESKSIIAFSNKPFEVGYDFIANLKNDRGVTLVFKQRIHQQEPKMWERQTAVRLLGSYNENNITNAFEYGIRGDSSLLSFDTSFYRQVNFSLGLEKQVVRKRMRLSFGADLIYSNKWGDRQSAKYTKKTTGTFLSFASTGTSRTRSLGISAFAGFNYYIFKFLSIGTEIHVPISVEHYISDSTSTDGLYHFDSYSLSALANIPRLLYLGFHF